MKRNFTEVQVCRVNSEGGGTPNSPDTLAIEEPLEIRLGYRRNGKATHNSVSITMRTPGDDFDLAAGFLFTEGIIDSPEQIDRIEFCGRRAKGSVHDNTVRVDLRDGVGIDLKRLERHFYTTSSCGVCGKTSIEALRTGVRQLDRSDEPVFRAEIVHQLPESLRARQDVFDRTGGLHAAALFDPSGEIELIREDVGRHNAVDKLIGSRFRARGTPIPDRLLLVSGRASFELVQKALMAGIPILAAVGAPSSLAVGLANEYGMTLLGFVRDGRFNIYTGAQRILQRDASAANAYRTDSFANGRESVLISQ